MKYNPKQLVTCLQVQHATSNLVMSNIFERHLALVRLRGCLRVLWMCPYYFITRSSKWW